jgi:Zn-dependent protease
VAIGTRPDSAQLHPGSTYDLTVDPAPEAEIASDPSPEAPMSTSPAAVTFYRVDSRRVTLREYWWEKPSAVPMAALLKLLRVRMSGATDDPCVERLAPFEVPADAVPRVVAQRFHGLVGQLTALGFQAPIWHLIEDGSQHVTTHLATMVHGSGRAWARVHNRIWSVKSPATSKLYVEIVSETSPGRYLWSLSSRPDLAAPPSCTVVREHGATAAKLWSLHQKALASASTRELVHVNTVEELRIAVDRLHERVIDFHISRGVFEPVSAEERVVAEQFKGRVEAAAKGGSKYPEIVAEVERLQNQPSRKNGMILLLISLGLFIGSGLTSVGGNAFSMDVLAILVGALFFHEMGHWVAMRIFGYRDLKMFFIPFFGAAVSGKHHNVAGWKKAVVSLMGPVPGIVVGSIIGVIGLATNQPLLIEIATITLILNGLNLLPVLPMDGGWVLQSILLARHHMLELLFRVLAIGALFVGGAVTGDRILSGLAIVMALSLPAMHKLARITNALRKADLPAVADDEQSIPAATAEAIVARLKESFPKGLSNKGAAQYALNIFENLNARPPGALASIGLGFLQVASFMTAVAVTALLLMGSTANIDAYLEGARAVQAP